MTSDKYQKLANAQAQREQDAAPFDKAQVFLWDYWCDADNLEGARPRLTNMAKWAPGALANGVKVMETLLQTPDDYDLLELVTCDADQTLSDATQEAAIAWLQECIVFVNGILATTERT